VRPRLGLVPPGNEADRRLARIARTVELEVVPRLVLARRAVADHPAVAPAGGHAPSAADIVELTGLALAHDTGAAVATFVDSLRSRGATMQALYLDLLAPTARRLGELWVADLCHFADVTLAVCRLQKVVHDLGPAFRRETRMRENGRRALLVPVPQEQHSFGLLMVADFFRRAGWEVSGGPLEARGDLVAAVRDEWFAVVGLSVGSERQLDTAAAGVRAVRRASRNRSVGVMVGGPVFVEHPEFVALVGADATAADGQDAVRHAQGLLELTAGRA
jgi:methylmalonyl-CoA mutase cobalamin-binding subunit